MTLQQLHKLVGIIGGKCIMPWRIITGPTKYTYFKYTSRDCGLTW